VASAAAALPEASPRLAPSAGSTRRSNPRPRPPAESHQPVTDRGAGLRGETTTSQGGLGPAAPPPAAPDPDPRSEPDPPARARTPDAVDIVLVERPSIGTPQAGTPPPAGRAATFEIAPGMAASTGRVAVAAGANGEVSSHAAAPPAPIPSAPGAPASSPWPPAPPRSDATAAAGPAAPLSPTPMTGRRARGTTPQPAAAQLSSGAASAQTGEAPVEQAQALLHGPAQPPLPRPRPAQPPAPAAAGGTTAATPRPQGAPEVSVRIGRVELRTPPPAVPAPAPRRPAGPPPVRGFAEYALLRSHLDRTLAG
jgi:hypothetical protein